jgi:peptide-methionine (R)-S-oxide reductase
VAGYPKQNEWETVLTPGQDFVLRNSAERNHRAARSSPLLNEKRKGTFVCAGCKAPLFDSLVKFESGTGNWARAGPRSRRRLRVETLTSFTSFALGSELRCADCGGHLGDVFNDGKAFRGTPAFESGLRFRLRYSLTVLHRARRRPGVPARAGGGLHPCLATASPGGAMSGRPTSSFRRGCSRQR